MLLILAGVSIAMLAGENGILGNAEKAIAKSENAQIQENATLADYENEIGEYTISNKGNGLPKAIEDLTAGQYVNYIDKSENIIPCIVLYDMAYNTENNLNYGVQIIAAEPIITVDLGNGIGNKKTDAAAFDIAKESYNTAITILNNKSREYLNTNLASEARCVGSVPDNPNSEKDYLVKDTTEHTAWWDTYKLNGTFRAPDTNYSKDYNRMKELNIIDANRKYWFASRSGTVNSSTKADFGVMFYDKSFGYSYFCVMDSSGNMTSNNFTNYWVRPVFTLNSTVKLTDGKGTKDNPYILE